LRADKFVANALKISRNQASELIKNGQILLDGEILTKSSSEISSGEIRATGDIYVSRAALKLKEFLKETELNLSGISAIDIGASTGGFTQILLENGAKSVVCVDVGTNQLHENLRSNPRIKFHENTDIRDFHATEKFDILTCDVSFISLLSVLEAICAIEFEQAILLFKPQFEVGISARRSKLGVVKDEKAVNAAMKRFEVEAAKNGLIMILKSESKIKGKSGNTEYFYLFKKGKNV